MTQEAALAAGHSQEQVDAYQAIQDLILGRSAEGDVTRQQFCQTLMKHDENDCTRAKFGLAAPTADAATPVAAFRTALEEAFKGMDGGAEAKTTASEVAAFLATFKAPTGDPQAIVKGVGGEAPAIEASAEAAATDATAVPPLALPTDGKKENFKLEFNSEEFTSKTSRPQTSTKVPSRFANRPVTSRRASKSSTTARRPGRPLTSRKKKTKEEIQKTKTIAALIIEADVKQVGCVTRADFSQTLEKHAGDEKLAEELQKKIGIEDPKFGETPAIAIRSFRKSIDEGVKGLDQGIDGQTSVPEIASFLQKYHDTIMKVVHAVC